MSWATLPDDLPIDHTTRGGFNLLLRKFQPSMTKEELAECEREIWSFLGKYCADHNLEHKLPQPVPDRKPKPKRVRRKKSAVQAAIHLERMKRYSTSSADERTAVASLLALGRP
jgi:hypothetical protein